MYVITESVDGEFMKRETLSRVDLIREGEGFLISGGYFPRSGLELLSGSVVPELRQLLALHMGRGPAEYFTDHSAEHSLCVVALCRRFCTWLDLEILPDLRLTCYMGALIHDVGRAYDKQAEAHHCLSEETKEILIEHFDVPRASIDDIAQLIILHSSKATDAQRSNEDGHWCPEDWRVIKPFGDVLRMVDCLDCTYERVNNREPRGEIVKNATKSDPTPEGISSDQRKEDLWQCAVREILLNCDSTGNQKTISIAKNVWRHPIFLFSAEFPGFDVVEEARRNIEKDVLTVSEAIEENSRVTVAAELPAECFDSSIFTEQLALALMLLVKAESSVRDLILAFQNSGTETSHGVSAGLHRLFSDYSWKLRISGFDPGETFLGTEEDWESQHRRICSSGQRELLDNMDLRALNWLLQKISCMEDMSSCEGQSAESKTPFENLLTELRHAAFYSRALRLGRSIGEGPVRSFNSCCTEIIRISSSITGGLLIGHSASHLGINHCDNPGILKKIRQFPLRCLDCYERSAFCEVDCVSIYNISKHIKDGHRFWGVRLGTLIESPNSGTDSFREVSVGPFAIMKPSNDRSDGIYGDAAVGYNDANSVHNTASQNTDAPHARLISAREFCFLVSRRKNGHLYRGECEVVYNQVECLNTNIISNRDEVLLDPKVWTEWTMIEEPIALRPFPGRYWCTVPGEEDGEEIGVCWIVYQNGTGGRECNNCPRVFVTRFSREPNDDYRANIIKVFRNVENGVST